MEQSFIGNDDKRLEMNLINEVKVLDEVWEDKKTTWGAYN